MKFVLHLPEVWKVPPFVNHSVLVSFLIRSYFTTLATIIEPELPLSNKTLSLCNLLLPNRVSRIAVLIGAKCWVLVFFVWGWRKSDKLKHSLLVFFYVLHAHFNNIADKWFRRAYNSANMSEHAIFQHDASLFFYPPRFFPSVPFSCATPLSVVVYFKWALFTSVHCISTINAQ